MKELSDLVAGYDENVNCSLEPVARAFGLENGKKQLNKHFKNVELIRYKDGLEVTEAEPLINYVLSFTRVKNVINNDKIKDFREYIGNVLNENGKIKIEKESGMFIARNPVNF